MTLALTIALSCLASFAGLLMDWIFFISFQPVENNLEVLGNDFCSLCDLWYNNGA